MSKKSMLLIVCLLLSSNGLASDVISDWYFVSHETINPLEYEACAITQSGQLTCKVGVNSFVEKNISNADKLAGNLDIFCAYGVHAQTFCYSRSPDRKVESPNLDNIKKMIIHSALGEISACGYNHNNSIYCWSWDHKGALDNYGSFKLDDGEEILDLAEGYSFDSGTYYCASTNQRLICLTPDFNSTYSDPRMVGLTELFLYGGSSPHPSLPGLVCGFLNQTLMCKIYYQESHAKYSATAKVKRKLNTNRIPKQKIVSRLDSPGFVCWRNLENSVLCYSSVLDEMYDMGSVSNLKFTEIRAHNGEELMRNFCGTTENGNGKLTCVILYPDVTATEYDMPSK